MKQLHIHIHHHNHPVDEVTERIFSLLNKIQMSNEELAQELKVVRDQLEKIKVEITTKDAAQEAQIAEQQQKITVLEEALAAAGVVDPNVLAALADVKSSLQAVDDINPDAPAEPPAEPPVV